MTFTCKCGREFRSWPRLIDHLTDHNVAYPKRQNRLGDPHGCARVTQESLDQWLARYDSQGHPR